MTEFKSDKVYKHKYTETKEEFIEKSIHNLKAIYLWLLYEEHFCQKIIKKKIMIVTVNKNNIISKTIRFLKKELD